MAVFVAEFLGKRADKNITILPVLHHFDEIKKMQFAEIPPCPFNGLPCSKMNKTSNSKFPVCSLRRDDGELYIVCENRLVSSSKHADGSLSAYQRSMLLTLAQEIFTSEITSEQLLFKAELTMASKKRADYSLSVTPNVPKTYGPRKLLVEMQGGGETNSTDKMTSHIAKWATSENPTSEVLLTPISIGSIQDNAWKRLQEQIFGKGSVAVKSGFGFVACVGTLVFDLVGNKINGFDSIRMAKGDEWDTALIAYSEARNGTAPLVEGSIPLEIDYSRIVYTTYDKLSRRLIERGVADPKSFSGPWRKLNGELFSEDGKPFKKPGKQRKLRNSKKRTSPNEQSYQMELLFNK